MNEYELMKGWAEAAGLGPESALVDHALRIRTGLQRQLLRTVYDNLESMTSVLERWERGGTNTYGMTTFASAWRRRPSTYDVDIHSRSGQATARGIPGRPLGHPPNDKEFAAELQAETLSLNRDALYLVMQCQVPQGADTHAHLNLRAWVFLKGLQLATDGATTADALLADACHALRRAAYELPNGRWRQALAPLGVWSPTHAELSRHLETFKEPTHTQGEQSRVLKRIARFAAGKTQALPEGQKDAYQVDEEAWGHVRGQLNAKNVTEDEYKGRDSSTYGVTSRSGETAAERTAQELTAVEVDPDSSPFTQSLHVRAARLQLGAAARFLAWDWPQMTPKEVRGFDDLISSSLLPSSDARVRLLAALSWIGREAGLTLDESLQVPLEPLDSHLGDAEWSIDIQRGMLKRRPPRRADHRHISEKQRDAITPSAAFIEIPIVGPALDALRASLNRRPLARLSGQLWADPTRTPWSSFGMWVKGSADCQRVVPSMASRQLAQRTYVATRDHVLARLLPSTPDSALPASTVYTAYRESDVRQVWPDATGTPSSTLTNLNVAGSLLDPDGDEHLEDGFRIARKAIELHGHHGDWIDFHNATTCYWDALLRAATGVRPTNDLWTTPADFDWDLALVFIDDKASPVAETGRLLPLPATVCQAFRHRYLEEHLPWVLARLGVETPNDMRERPLLFLIESGRSGRQLVPVTNERRQKIDVEGGLPLNVFRHRLRTHLHRMPSVDKEVIDTLMGHGDGATLTHGDFSMRTWREDIDAVRSAIELAYDGLKIVPPPMWREFAQLAALGPASSIPVTLRITQAKKTKGPNKAAAALRFIKNELRAMDFARNRSDNEPEPAASDEVQPSNALLSRLSRMSESELDTLSLRLFSRKDGLPDTMGALRYSMLLKLGEMLWARHGLRLQIRRRYFARSIEDSPFTRDAPRAASKLASIRAALDKAFLDLPNRSRYPLGQVVSLLLFDLCITSRITHPPLLESLLESKDRWRVVSLGRSFYLEWSPDSDLTIDRQAACMRFPISVRSAWLLTTHLASKMRRKQAFEGSHVYVRSLAAAASEQGDMSAHEEGTSCKRFLERIQALVDQCNIMELPGTVAGYLAGRVWTPSLGWGEWLRVKEGRWVNTDSIDLLAPQPKFEGDEEPDSARRYADIDEDDPDDVYDPSASTRLVRRAAPGGSPNARSLAALSLVRHVQRSIRKLQETKGLTKRREARAERLSTDINRQAGEVSSMIRLLCLWAIDMLLRPGRSRKLATSSVDRYFVALSPRILAIGWDVEIDVMDDEQIETFYSNLMDIAPVKQLKEVYDGLRSFHRFAHESAGLPDIDWSGIATTQKLIFGSPGFIDEATYLRLQDRLADDTGCPSARPWHLQSFLVFAYRFGLRGGEIAGLASSDIVWDAERPYVLVRRNKLRALKTTSGRRIVPTLFELTPKEQNALRTLQDAVLPSVEGRASGAPLFSMPSTPDTPVDHVAIRAHLNAAIKQMTGQAGLSLHDLRHSFGTHVWAATQPLGWKVLGQATPNQDSDAISGLLLGPGNPMATRRSPWALARLMGHSHPETALKSYVHCISDTLPQLIDVAAVRTPTFVQSDKLRAVRPGLASDYAEAQIPKQSEPPRPPTPADALVALRFISEFRPNEDVAKYTRLSATQVQELRKSSLSIFQPLASSKRSGLAKHVSVNANRSRLANDGLAAFVRASAFKRLREGLAGLTPEHMRILSSIDAITVEQWSGMIGERREISMWLPNQFALFGLAIRQLTQTPRDIELAVPATRASKGDMESPMNRHARATGWLPVPPSSSNPSSSLDALCTKIGTIPTAPAVRLEESGVRVERRAVMLFGGGPAGVVRDRLELLVCALCMNLFTKQVP